MQSLRNNRRLLGATLLTVVCFIASAVPADAMVRPDGDWSIESRISRVFERRERVEILDAIDAMETALEYARAKAEANEGPIRDRALLQVQRIEQLLELARLGRALLDALVKRARVDATPLMAILLGKKIE